MNGNAANSGPARSKRVSWVLLFAFAVAVVLLYLTLRGLDWETFWTTIRNGNYAILLITVPIASLNYLIRAARWSVFVRAEKSVSVISVFWANMVGYLGNAYLPARAGEILRSVFLGRERGLGVSFVLATALTERALDVIALVIIGSIAVLTQNAIPMELKNAVRVTAAVGVAGLILILALPHQERLALGLAGKLPLGEKFRAMLTEQISRFLIGMRSLQNAKRSLTFITLTIIIWLVDAIANVIGVRIIGQTLNIGQALILLAALGLSSAIPSTPGYVGIYQFVAVAVLVPFGFSRVDALAYILISQILNYLVITFWGLIGLWRINTIGDPAASAKDISAGKA
ncbi:MAG TPA: lysylphosphatidylglycerol synthase transmembrane domain-containing protein, partial [Anaerolineales bacterium]|nr:lysylphosphatidylglycerol synthase transmembrane domain-containing protein [Anaerolineales bacterium]